jgi:dsRNA-specific ribonuclease
MSEFKVSHDDDIVNSADGLLFNPYNSNNVEITLSQVQSILTKYGVRGPVHNMALYKRAFVHKSYTKRPQLYNLQENITITEQPIDCLPLHTKSNERLEFLGDGVLECITKYYLYRRFPKENEGFMTEKKIALVKNEAIGKLALEMGLHKYYIISKHAEEKKTRTNLKKLGCLFESFLGALFLDFNKIEVLDEEGWFKNVFVTGPGFQMAQIFVESIFEKHVDWVKLIRDDDNYKNILQVKIQKEFKDTPHYIEMSHDDDIGYEMGVYLCLGQKIHEVRKENAVNFASFGSFENIQTHMETDGKVFVFLGKGSHKIKRKAEQMACEETLKLLESYVTES